MADSTQEPRPFRFSDPRHERIYSRLGRLIGPGAAAFFRDACKLVGNHHDFESTSHLVGHLLRETEGSIRWAFQPLIRSAGPARKEPGETHRYEIEQTLRALDISLDDPIANAWFAISGKDNERGLTALAHRSGLGPPRHFDSEAAQAFHGIVTVLDAILEKVEGQWEVFLATFDNLAATEHPTDRDADELRSKLPSSLQARAHFFNQLQRPAWLEPLERRGFFRQPPEPVRDDEAGTIRFLEWPESQYLIRIATHGSRDVQEHVVRIAEAFPDSENVSVYEDLAAIALAVPVELSLRLVPRIEGKLPLRYSARYPVHVADLVVHLVGGGLGEEARKLARTLLTVDPDPRTERYEGPTEGQRLGFPEPQPRMHPAYFDVCIGKIVPYLFKEAPAPSVSLVADLLENAIRLSQRTRNQGLPEIHSQVWWPDLGRPRPRLADDPPAILLEALCEGILDLVAREPAAVIPLIVELERRPLHVFKRLVLFLSRIVPGVAISDIETRLLKLEDHESLELSSEYEALLNAFYPQLSEEGQRTIREYLAQERALDSAVASFRSWEGRDPTAGELEKRQDEWRAQRLRPIAEYLPRELKGNYDRWAKVLVPEAASQLPPASWSSDRSPVSAEELGSMPDQVLTTYLSTVRLSDARFGASREGLGHSLAESVTANPGRFSQLAIQFGALDPAYQHSLFTGLLAAVIGRTAFPWGPVLDTAGAITSQPRTIVTRRVNDQSPDESWVRKAIADLLTRGMQPGPGEIPFELRAQVWSALRMLTDDPDPTEADDAVQADTHGRESLFLDSIRGRALESVWAYVVWVYRHAHEGRSEPMTFGPIPEVREILEKHLDPGQDPSPSVRLFYGTRLQQLRRLDSDWLYRQLGRIFPEEPLLLRRVVWWAFLRHTEVQPADFELLRPIYEAAVRELEANPVGDEREACEHLGGHIMRLQWLGVLSVRERGGLLDQFFEGAGVAIREATLSFVGHALNNTKDPVPPQVLERMRELWEWRRGAAERAPGQAPIGEELAAFGWWFLCPQLDPIWALRELEHALRLARRVEMTPSVVGRIASLSAEFPLPAIKCLALIVVGRDRKFGPEFWLQEVRPILENGRRSPNRETQQAAIALINRLSSMGHTQFRDLL